jgi:hypothetical protein
MNDSDYKNTTPEMYDDPSEQDTQMSQEEVLMNERDILEGLIRMGNAIDKKENFRKIQIKRKGQLLIEFRVRPITEDETERCIKRATPTVRDRKVKPETNWAKFRSYLIYTATVDEDRAKVWDNKEAHNALGILQGVDMIDKIIFAGEKSRIIDIIEEISETDESADEQAKN